MSIRAGSVGDDARKPESGLELDVSFHQGREFCNPLFTTHGRGMQFNIQNSPVGGFGMIQFGHGASFAQILVQGIIGRNAIQMRDFDGNVTLKLAVVRLETLPSAGVGHLRHRASVCRVLRRPQSF